jgi:hypothetical protein
MRWTRFIKLQGAHIKARGGAGMSDLFAELGSFRFPDTRMNQGPLPSVAGGPAGSDGTPDSRINHTNELLRNITPYAFGQAARMGSDRNYQQVPHRVQQMVQQVAVPNPQGTAIVKIPHVVDNGELAFVVLSNGRSVFSHPYWENDRPNPPTIPQFANLDVVNYVLCCLQQEAIRLIVPVAGRRNYWHAVFEEVTKGQVYRNGRTYYTHWTTDPSMAIAYDKKEFYFHVAKFLTSNIFIPFGICAGSEKQGGQHEGGFAPVQSAVNYVTTMTVDGQNRDLMNYWHAHMIQAGDRLILALRETRPPKPQEMFSLNSYYKEPITQTVTVGATPYWQLKAQVYGCETQAVAGLDFGEFDYRLTAYWHIAQTFQCRKGDAHTRSFNSAPPLQVTFSPVLQRMDGYLNGVPALPPFLPPGPMRAVVPGMALAPTAAVLANRATLAATAAANAAAAVVAATTAAAAAARLAAAAAAAAAAAGAIPACLAAQFGTIPEMQAILLFYGIYVLELNGRVDITLPAAGYNRALYDAAAVVRTNWKAAPGLVVAFRTKVYLQATITAFLGLGTGALACLKACNDSMLVDFAARDGTTYAAIEGAHRPITFPDFNNGALTQCGVALTARVITEIEDAELFTFIEQLCKHPGLFMDKGVAGNALLRPCLSILSVYHRCRNKQNSNVKRPAIYENFRSFGTAAIDRDLVALCTKVVNATGQTDAGSEYYSGAARLQRSIEVLQLDDYSDKLKSISTFDLKSTRYMNAISRLEAVLHDIAAGTVCIPLNEVSDISIDYQLMSTEIAAHLDAFNVFNATYNSTVALLQVADADTDAVIQSQRAQLLRMENSLDVFYAKHKQRLIWTALYCRAVRLFFAESRKALIGMGFGGILMPNHALYQPYYDDLAGGGAAVIDAAGITLLELMRDDARTIAWMLNSPHPVIRLRETFADVLTGVQAQFAGVAINPRLLTYMVAQATMMSDSVAVAVAIDVSSLETFESGTPRQFSLNAALDSFASAAEAPGRAIGDGQGAGGTAGPKGGAVKAGAKKTKKIRFELDDAQCPTIAEDAGV